MEHESFPTPEADPLTRARNAKLFLDATLPDKQNVQLGITSIDGVPHVLARIDDAKSESVAYLLSVEPTLDAPLFLDFKHGGPITAFEQDLFPES